MQVAQHQADPQDETQRVDDARHSVNTALTTLALCIDFLAEQSGTRGREAVVDARDAVCRIAAEMDGLSGDAELGAPDGATSGVFRRSDPPASNVDQAHDDTG